MDAKKQEDLRQYLLHEHTRMRLTPPRGNTAEHIVSHYAEMFGQALAVIEYAAEELKQ